MAYVTYTLNLWGPIIKMSNAAFGQAVEEGKKRLREFLEASDTGRQAMAMSTGDERYEMSRMNGNRTKAAGRTGDEVDNEIDDI